MTYVRRFAILSAAALALGVSACDAPSSQREESSPQALEQAADTAAFLGPVSYRYDPAVLGTATVQLPVPGQGDTPVYGTKLLPLRGVSGAAELCPEDTVDCRLEDQPGITLALLERPFAIYEQALRESELSGQMEPVVFAGTNGIAIDAGREGDLALSYRIAPVNDRALLVQIQRDGETPAEEEAIGQVVESIAIEH